MNGRMMAWAIIVAVCGAAAGAQVPITGMAGISLEDIEGTSTLVTVVLKTSGAQDPNCTIVDVGPDYLSVVSADGERNAYLFSAISEIRVQGEELDVEPFELDAGRALNDEDQAVVDYALSRAQSMFNNATTDQVIRMDAAAILAHDGDQEALRHLTELATTNDLETSLQAILRLYVVGEDIGGYEELNEGLESGDRAILRIALTLAGLTGDPQHVRDLRRASEDRVAEIAAPAIIALARLDDRQSIPSFVSMLSDVNPERGIAAMQALKMLGGDETIALLKDRLDNAVRIERYRIIAVLYVLGDPMGEQLLKGLVEDVPTLRRRASIVLAGQGDYEARLRLTDLLSQRYDPDLDTLYCRAEMAGALMEGGDRKSIAVFQDVLRADQPLARQFALQVIAQLMKRNLMTIIRPAIDDESLRVNLRACQAAVAMADPSFAARLTKSWYDTRFVGRCDL